MNVHIRHAFRDFPEYPALVDASNAVATASIGCKCCDEGPDLLCVAELDGEPVASVHFSYDWDSRSWSVGDVAFKAPLSDKVARQVIEEAEPLMANACSLVGAESPTIKVELGRDNFDAQAEYATMGFLFEPGPVSDLVTMRRPLRQCARRG